MTICHGLCGIAQKENRYGRWEGGRRIPAVCSSTHLYNRERESDHPEREEYDGAGHCCDARMRGPVGCGLPPRGSSVIPHCT